MILVNTDYISGKNFEMIGLVRGTMIQSVHFGKDIMNSFKTLVGGELTSYTEMMNEARAIATKRMCDDAQAMGTDAVVNIRYASSAVMQGAAEVMAYGTAVKFVE
ncbi:YbjQ family protein [[Clostridium] scindens]|uniref:YbjQ family protein n=1 Tax=Clostridium scindens (strain JCM 10418 / VPI 12708) TaxID=29347 RepID=UPI0039F46C38